MNPKIIKIYLVTGNRHKLEEARQALAGFPVSVAQLKEEKYEPKEMSLEEVSAYNAELFFKKYRRPICVDDTGIFFKAYPNFPGSHPRLIYEMLGYKGIFKVISGEVRDAFFKTAVGYCDEKGVKIFSGILKCRADIRVNDPDKDVLPYERIMLIDGKALSSYSREEKGRISHRSIAFRKLGEYLRGALPKK